MENNTYGLKRLFLLSLAALTVLLLLCGALETAAQTAEGHGGHVPKPPQGASSPANNRGAQRTDLVIFKAIITDLYGRFVTGLTKEAFRVFENGVEKQIGYFNDEEEEALSVCFVLDLSNSTSMETANKIRQSLSTFIEISNINDADEFFLLQLRTRIYPRVETLPAKRGYQPQLMPIEISPGAGLLEASSLCAGKARQSVRNSERILLLITDMTARNSIGDSAQVQRELKEHGISLYTIGLLGAGTDWVTASNAEEHPVFILDDISTHSGGEASFFKSSVDINNLLERWAVAFRHMYTIGFEPTSSLKDMKSHNIKIKLTPPRGLPRVYVRKKGHLRMEKKP